MMDLASYPRFIFVYTILMSMLVSATFCIRVDWNTRNGPILPPTPSPPSASPRQPYAEPAPVWEDQSNDIPNPDPYRYVPPPPSRPRFNQNNNDIETNEIPNNRENNIGANGYASKNYNDYNKQNNYDGFFVNIPPKFYKSAAKQQYYQQQQLNDILNQNYYSKTNKYNIIAFKDKYYNVPYYVFYFARVPSQQ